MASEFVHRWLDSFNSRTFPIEDLYTSDCTLTEGGPTMHGPDEVRAYFTGYVAAFPDGRNERVNAVEASDGIVIEVRFTGTNTGPMGETPPTGNRLDWPFVVVFDMQNGKAKAHRGYGDQVALMTQLGLMPWPGERLAQAGRREAARRGKLEPPRTPLTGRQGTGRSVRS
jgi:predicted ester cyclase